MINQLYLKIINKPRLNWAINIYLRLFGIPLLAKRLRHKYAKELINNNLKGSIILDAGCTIGDFSLFLASRGASVIGIDIVNKMEHADSLAKECNLNIEFKTADLFKIKYENYFDGIIALDLLEHIKNDKGLLDKLNLMAKEGSYLITSVPSIFRRLNLTHEKAVGHVREGYSISTFRKLLEETGFEIEEIFYVDPFDKIYTFYSIRNNFIKAVSFPLFMSFFDKKAKKDSDGSLLICRAVKTR